MKDLYDGIAREFQADALQLQSQTLQDIFTHLEAGTTLTALGLVPRLGDVEFEQNRQRIAQMAGVRPAALDKLRKKAEKAQSTKALQGKELQLPEIIPAVEPQSGPQLLDDVAKQIRRFIVADDISIYAITLWIIFAHIAHKAQVCPNLVFTSAVKSCGKSTALDVVSRLVPKPLATANISVAALFRTVEMLAPTLLIDEADSMFRNSDDLRTLVNSGFTRTAANVLRIVGDELVPRMFDVFTPKAIALIGSLPDTIESRSVVIRMRRRLPAETLERLRSDRDQNFVPLASRIARWTSDNITTILAEEPEVPESLTDRQADVWRELLRIADIAGGDWPERARNAALELCAKENDDADLTIRLLADIQRIMAERPERTRWPSAALADALNAMEEAPWADFNHGKGLTTNRLAKMLSRFDIHTKQIREDAKGVKGYSTEAFHDVFSRYLPNETKHETNCDNSLHNNDLQSFGSVSVSDAKRNIPDEPDQDGMEELDIF